MPCIEQRQQQYRKVSQKERLPEERMRTTDLLLYLWSDPHNRPLLVLRLLSRAFRATAVYCSS